MKKVERKVTFRDVSFMFQKLQSSGLSVDEIMPMEVDMIASDFVRGSK